MKPSINEHAPYYKQYVDLVSESNLIKALEQNTIYCIDFFKSIPTEKFDFAYAENKWTVKSVWQHLIDCERIFVYRALSIARGETQALIGFDEDAYAKNDNTKLLNADQIFEDFVAVRNATNIFYKNLQESDFIKLGTANANPISVQALGFIIVGHSIHHTNIIKQRYL